MFGSFRLRLTLWYVAALGLLLVLFSLGVYSLLARSIYGRLDSGLQSAMEVTTLSLNHEIVEHGGKDQGEASVREVLSIMSYVSFPGPSIAILQGNRLVGTKPGAEGAPLPLLSAVAVSPGERAFRILTVNGVRYRAGWHAAPVPSIGQHYMVVAGQTMSAVDNELAGVARILGVCVLAGLLLAALGGYFLAGRSLAPIAAIRETAEHISSANLHERVPAGNPKDELGKLAGTFNQLLTRLDVAFEQQRRFMADASHELRTPLSVALTAAQVNLRGGLRSAEDYREALQIVSEQLVRLKRLVQDMFVLARADAGALRPAGAFFYMEELVTETVRGARVIGDAKGVSVSIGATGHFPWTGDAGLIRQVLSNLLDNAIRHTEPGGMVTVALYADELHYRLVVSDTGTGIPEADQPYIFNRFYRADKARSRADSMSGGGAGLGLAIARRVVEIHGGHIELLSSSALGSVFAILLPVQAPAPADDPAALTAQPPR